MGGPNASEMQPIFSYIDGNFEGMKKLLADAVAIPSVSPWATHRDHIMKMGDFAAKKLEELGAKVEKKDIGTHEMNGETLKLPPIVFARLGEDSKKKTLLVYGHLDVMPADITDGWNTDPWKLTEKDGKLYGRGSTDDKGPVMAWLCAIEAYLKSGKKELPVNLRFILEGMEESGSQGLDDLLYSMKKSNDPFFQNVDFAVISDSYWLGTKKPCLAYGLRGNVKFCVTIQCANADLHSGLWGSVVYEAMSDMMYVLNSLVDVKGNILIPGIMNEVRHLTAEEQKLYETIDFNVNDKKDDCGAAHLIHENDPARLLQGIWRFPCLSIHGIEGAYYEKGFKTVIPGKVIGKFSIRIVPDMTPAHVEKVVIEHLNKVWKERGSPNKFEIETNEPGAWYFCDPSGPNFAAASRATEIVHGVKPDYIREGGSIPISVTISDCIGKDVCLLPIGMSNDGAHSQNEKLDVDCYKKGIKTMAAYMHELSK